MTNRALGLLHLLVLCACFDPDLTPDLEDPVGGSSSGADGKPDPSTGRDDGGSGPEGPDTDGRDPSNGPDSGDDDPPDDVCGDGMPAPSEECDDGNLLDGDGCDADCTWGGKTQWSVVVDGGVGAADFARAMTLTGDGELVVVGSWSVVDEPAARMMVARFDDLGQRLWADDAGPGGIAYAVEVDDMDRIVTVGDGATGALLRRLGPAGALDLSVEGTDGVRRAVAVAGATTILQGGATADGHWIVEALDDGVVAWSDRSAAPGAAHAMRRATDGTIVVAGEIEDAAADRIVGRIVAYGPDGSVRSEQRVDLGHDTSLHAVVVPSPERFLVAGRAAGDAWVLEVDASGEVRWDDALDSGAGGDDAWDLALAPDGAVVVVGTAGTGVPGDTDAFVAKYSADGDFLWWRDFSGDVEGPDAARAVVVDPAGRIFVAGQLRVPDEAVNLWLAELSG